jgi:Domain of unknown function (DUF4160)
MPTIALLGPYRVFFYSDEGREPAHVHIEKDDSVAKFWLDPVELEENYDFPNHELRKLHRLVVEHQRAWLEKWHEFHKDTSTGK